MIIEEKIHIQKEGMIIVIIAEGGGGVITTQIIVAKEILEGEIEMIIDIMIEKRGVITTKMIVREIVGMKIVQRDQKLHTIRRGHRRLILLTMRQPYPHY